MGLNHQNDPDLIRQLLMDPGIWVVVGLSNNRKRTAHRTAQWLQVELGKPIIPVHRRAETVHGPGTLWLADIPDQDIKVIDCFVNSQRVGAVVDQVIAHKERLQIDAIWMQAGVVDQAAAERARGRASTSSWTPAPRSSGRGWSASGMQR